MEQISPNLKLNIVLVLERLNFPNHIPHKIKPGICVKVLLVPSESKTSPKHKPTINPSIDPLTIAQGNNQKIGQ